MKNTRHCFLSMFLTSALACAAAATAEPRTAPAGLGEPPRLRIESCPADLKAGLDAIKAEFPHRFGAVQEPGLRLIRFETLAAGVPTLCLSISDDHASAADALSGGLVHLGAVEDVSEQRIAHAVRNILRSNALTRLSENARQMVDGKGIERVAAKIIERISHA